MKKLLAFLMLLTASLPLWAYEFDHEGFFVENYSK